MKHPFFESVRAHLVLLVLISIVPAMGIILYSGLELRREAVREAEHNTMAVLGSLAGEHQRVEDGTRQLLMTLSQLPEVQRLDVAACSLILERLLIQNFIYAGLFVATADGTIIASASPLPHTYDIRHRKYFRDAVNTKSFSVGEYVIGGLSGQPVLHFCYPVMDGRGRFKGVVIAAVDLARYGEIFMKAGMPRSSVLYITDHKGIRLFRYPDAEKYLGRTGRPEAMSKMREGPEQSTFMIERGDRRLVAYRRFSLREDGTPYLFISVGVAEKEALSGARRLLTINLVLLGIAFLFALLSAFVIGRAAIVKRLGALVDASHRVGKGELSARTGLPYRRDELGRLALAFDEMAADLEKKENVRRRVEEALMESEERYRTAIEHSNDGVAILGQGVHLYVNRKFVEIFGYEDPAEIIGKPLACTVHPRDLRRVEDITTLRQRGEPAPGRYQFEGVRKGGEPLYVEVSATSMVYRGNPVSLAYIRDITERTRAEEALRESEERYRTLFETANDAILLIRDSVFVDCNEKALAMFGCIREQLLGQTPSRFSPPLQPDGGDSEEMVAKVLSDALDSGPQFFEWKHCRFDGTPFFTEVSLNRITLGTQAYLQTIIRDVTARRQSEEDIKTSLKEKEILLKEVHHRVKNNLQVISSLLSLQSRQVKEEGIKDIFRESIDRVKTMANIHAILYQSADYARINFRRFVSDLTSQLYLSYDPERGHMTCTTDVGDLFLDINSAIPCGLIINELVSNAMKHAFPPDRKGEISIAMHVEDEDVVLTVSDNGTGFPGHVDFRNTDTLGLQLVTELVEQLDGTIELATSAEEGSTFTIRFTEWD